VLKPLRLPPTGRCDLATAIAAELLLDKLLIGTLVAEVKLVERGAVVTGNCCAATLVTDADWVTMLRNGLVATVAAPLELPKLEDPGRTLAAEMPELCSIVDDAGCTTREVDRLVTSPLCKTWISLPDVDGKP